MKVNLYDLVMLSQKDYDVYDNEYNVETTVCYIDEENDYYDMFCNNIIKKVNVIGINGSSLIADWSNLIKNNLEKFKEFSNKYWNNSYEDDIDEFIYQWIKEIHMYMCGYVSNDFYKILTDFIDTLE